MPAEKKKTKAKKKKTGAAGAKRKTAATEKVPSQKKAVAKKKATTRRMKPKPPPEFHPPWESRLDKLIHGRHTLALQRPENLALAVKGGAMTMLEEDLYVTTYEDEEKKFCLLFSVQLPDPSHRRSELTMNALRIVERITLAENVIMSIDSKDTSDGFELLCVIDGTREDRPRFAGLYSIDDFLSRSESARVLPKPREG